VKQRRQAKIIEIVENNDIETQDELLTKLTEAGFNTTQATISRDIRDINLTKVSVPGGRQKYALGKSAGRESINSYKQVLSTCILSMEAAENLIVIKTVSGMAMAVGAALDNLSINGLMGCIAGDDTLFLAVRSRELVKSVITTIERYQK
jgi:transcriptional regulator of arginine metabolism